MKTPENRVLENLTITRVDQIHEQGRDRSGSVLSYLPLLVTPSSLGGPHQDEENLLPRVRLVCDVNDIDDLQNVHKKMRLRTDSWFTNKDE
jgi:hypothetical protein